jgi:hypothetical protein
VRGLCRFHLALLNARRLRLPLKTLVIALWNTLGRRVQRF